MTTQTLDVDLARKHATRAADLFGRYEFLTVRQALRIAWDDVAPDAIRSLAYQCERYTFPIWWSAGVACGLNRADAVNVTWTEKVDPHVMLLALRGVAERGLTEMAA